MPSFAPRRQQSFPIAPIPGTEPARRALFVDRWGTLLAPTEGSTDRQLEQLEFTPGAVDALFRATQAGWRIYLIGNEDGVAHGQVDDALWETFEANLLGHLRAHGVGIGRNYACLDHPEGQGDHRRNSVFRLPETGLFYHAAQNDGVALGDSWVIGDSTVELVGGTRAGCRSVALQSGVALADRALDIDPHVQAENLAAAVELFLQAETYARR